jgi:hypothetical protein
MRFAELSRRCGKCRDSGKDGAAFSRVGMTALAAAGCARALWCRVLGLISAGDLGRRLYKMKTERQ